MIKIIQTIALTAIVFSPLSLISLVTSATAHHNSSHVSTVAVATTKVPKKKRKKGVKPASTDTNQQQPAPDAITQPPATMPSVPVNPTQPDASSDNMKRGTIKPKPGSIEIPPAGSSVPGTPGVPGMPTVPGSGTPTIPTTIPATK